MAPLLELNDVKARYGQVEALHGVSLSVGEGEVVAVLRGIGAGKTTTLRAISGLVTTSGEVSFSGERITRASPEKVARIGVAHVPEGRGIFSELSVHENLRLGAYLRRDGFAGDYERVRGYFPWLEERRDQQAGTLSGGEQQMLAVSRALMLRPKLMLLDEPSFGLAPLIVHELFAILRAVNQKEQVSMLVVEQNAAMALELADHAYVIETGRVVLSGTAADIKRDDNVRRAYLGY